MHLLAQINQRDAGSQYEFDRRRRCLRERQIDVSEFDLVDPDRTFAAMPTITATPIENNRSRIHRATVAVDCGVAVNPLTIESQFQAGVAFGVSQLMAQGAITLNDGRVEQRNFDGYVPPYPGQIRARSSSRPAHIASCATPSISVWF